MKNVMLIIAMIVTFSSVAMAADLSITSITPVFDPATPGFGDFSIKVGIKSNIQKTTQLNLACLYVGLTKPGVYYKNEPAIQKQYAVVRLAPMESKEILLPLRFSSYHPAMTGELIATLVGTEVVKSVFVKTSFHPNSQD